MTEHGEYAYDPTTRTVRGMLLPFGERTRAADARDDFYTAESIDVHTDPDVVTLNREHNRVTRGPQVVVPAG